MTDQKNDRTETESDTRAGVYICHCGGNISDHVDVEAVRQRVEKAPGVSVARTNMFMCSDPGQEMIVDDLRSGLVNRVVVASCAPSLHETTFRNAISRAGANPFIYEHANIREQVSWVHHGDPATDKATRMTAAAAAKAGRLKPLEPIRMEALPRATVIGGGIAGLRAAKDLAARGIEVTLVEKSPFLGGQLANLDHIAPTGDRAADLVSELAGQVLSDPAVTVHTSTVVETFEGYIGNFKLGLRQGPPEIEAENPKADVPELPENSSGQFIPGAGVFPGPIPGEHRTWTVETGVIVLATGFRTYLPRPGEYGFGDMPEVITLPELIRQMRDSDNGGEHLEVNGRVITSLAMIHCVGSRQIPGIHPEDEDGRLNEYCSRTCCSAVLNAANIIRTRHPQTHVYDFYRDIRTYGRGQEALYEEASRNSVVFLRFEVEDAPEVIRNTLDNGRPLTVKVRDTLTFGEVVEAPVDLVVLATGMEPNDVTDLVDLMKLPVGPDRFLLEVHPKLRPVELPNAGFLLAGTCQAPMDIGESCNAAGAAAVKAAALLGRGYVELDPFVAEVDLTKCTGTGACVEACLKEGALAMVDLDIDGLTVRRAQVTPALCLGCGACVAVCPGNAIEVNGWTLKQYEAMVDVIVSDQCAA